MGDDTRRSQSSQPPEKRKLEQQRSDSPPKKVYDGSKSTSEISAKLPTEKLGFSGKIAEMSYGIMGKNSEMPGGPLKLNLEKYYFTSKGRRIHHLDGKDQVPAVSLEKEMQGLVSIGLADKVELIKPPTNVHNPFGYAFLQGKGTLLKQDAEKIIQDNYDLTTIPQAGDRLVYRHPQSKELMHAVIVTEASKGEVKVEGQIWPGGAVFSHHPDVLKPLAGNWEFLREKENASLRFSTDLLVSGEAYVTSKGRSVEVYHSVQDFPALSLEFEKQRLERTGHADEMEMIEPPNPAYNCFGHAILDGKGWINNLVEADKAINDDFVSIEIPHSGDRLFYRDSSTGLPQHGVIVEKISKGIVSEVSSKEAESGLYSHEPDLLIESYGDWELRYKKTSAANDFKREKEQIDSYKEVIESAIKNPKSIKRESELTPAKLAASMLIVDQFKEATEQSIQKADISTSDNVQKHLELFRTKRNELSSISKQLQGNIEKHGISYDMSNLTLLEGTDHDKHLWKRYESLMVKSTSYDFENTLMRTLMENNGVVPKGAQERERQSKEASFIREQAVEAMVNGKEQLYALDQFSNFVLGQEHTRSDLLQTLNRWTKSLQEKVVKSSWSDDFKENATKYLTTLEGSLSSGKPEKENLILYNLFENTSAVLETLAKTDTNQAI